MFFHGEDAVTDALSPYINAAPREEQKYFLATQHVDEARHAVFFGRFMPEVAEAGSAMAGSLDATHPELTWGFRKTFARLERMADELRRDRSRPKLAQAIALYHVIIEGRSPSPASISSRATSSTATCCRVSAPACATSRSTSSGTSASASRCSRCSCARIPSASRRRGAVREVLSWTVAMFIPPDWDERYVTCFGFTLDDIYQQSAAAMEGRLRAAGIEPERLRTGL